jgi:uncharacterized YccA/Bax inhibitor family protein
MESRNPVLNREFGRDGQAYAGFGPAPTATAGVDAATLEEMYRRQSTTGQPMTVDDVVVKTGLLFVLLLFGAVAGWQIVGSLPWVAWASLAVAFVLGMVVSFKRVTSPPLIMAYALFEGVFVGGISRFFQEAYPGIVLQAVIGTFTAFGVMLVLYKTGLLRATPRFRKMMMIAMFSYLGIALVSLVSAFFGVGGGWGFYGVGGLGLLLCVAGVALASFSLVLDFDAIEQGVAAGLPEKESWLGAFGLVVTLVWLYLELLRLLAILQGRE